MSRRRDPVRSPNSNPTYLSPSLLPAAQYIDDSESYPGSKEINATSSSQWFDLKIADVTAATADVKDQAGSIGLVWLLTAVPSTPNGAEPDLMGGDLLAIYDYKLERFFLGVVHTWDPDYDRTSTHTQKAADGDGCFVNIMVTVDQKATLGSADGRCNGWFPQGVLVDGAFFSATILGNTMTSIREAQALMSMKFLDVELQNIILDPTLSISKANRQPYPSSSKSAAGGASIMARPPTVPSRLWASLESQYNESQLRAIGSICEANKTNFTLLQGPPGTGKTRTILAIVAVILAGSVGAARSRGQSIVPGMSLSTHSTNAPVAIGTSHEATVLPLGAKVASVLRITSPPVNSQNFRHPYAHPSVSTSLSIYLSIYLSVYLSVYLSIYCLPASVQVVTSPRAAGDAAGRTRVLVCAPSNAAANEIAYRLQTQGVLGPVSALTNSHQLRGAFLSISGISNMSCQHVTRTY